MAALARGWPVDLAGRLAAWPQPITSDRSTVQVPEPLGCTLRKHASDDEFQAVVWTGGWADVRYVLGGEVYTFCPEFRDVDGAYSAVTKEVEDFPASGTCPPSTRWRCLDSSCILRCALPAERGKCPHAAGARPGRARRPGRVGPWIARPSAS